MTGFNLEDELEDGYDIQYNTIQYRSTMHRDFDEEGNFVVKKRDDERDAWLDSIVGSNDIYKPKVWWYAVQYNTIQYNTMQAPAAMEDDDDSEPPELSAEDRRSMLTRISDILQPHESVTTVSGLYNTIPYYTIPCAGKCIIVLFRLFSS